MMGLAKHVLRTYETLVRRPGLPKALRYTGFMDSHWIVAVYNCDKEIRIIFCEFSALLCDRIAVSTPETFIVLDTGI
jgi:hypothetical protein